MSCIDPNIIGITDRDCVCYDNKPADAGVSLTGYYITDCLPLSIVSMLENCEIPNFWEELEKQKLRAIQEVEDAVYKKFYAEYKKRFKACRSNIGDVGFGTTLNTGTTYAGIKLSDFVMPKGCLVLHGFQTGFANSGNVDIHLYSNQSNQILQTFTVAANVKHTLTDIFEIEAFLEGCDDLEYYLIYETTNQPRKNRCHCSCKSRKCWEKYTSAIGIIGDDLNDIANWKTTPDVCYGISIDAQFECKEDLLCEGLSYNNAFSRCVAKAVQQKAVFGTLKSLFSSGIQSVYQAVCKEDLDGMMLESKDSFDELICEVYESLPKEDSICFSCKSGVRRARL